MYLRLIIYQLLQERLSRGRYAWSWRIQTSAKRAPAAPTRGSRPRGTAGTNTNTVVATIPVNKDLGSHVLDHVK